MPPPGSGSGSNGARPPEPLWLVVWPPGSSRGNLGPSSPVTRPMTATDPARRVFPRLPPPVTCVSSAIEISMWLDMTLARAAAVPPASRRDHSSPRAGMPPRVGDPPCEQYRSSARTRPMPRPRMWGSCSVVDRAALRRAALRDPRARADDRGVPRRAIDSEVSDEVHIELDGRRWPAGRADDPTLLGQRLSTQPSRVPAMATQACAELVFRLVRVGPRGSRCASQPHGAPADDHDALGRRQERNKITSHREEPGATSHWTKDATVHDRG